MATKKTPTRTCVVCGKSGEKRDFVRIVRTPEGEVRCDETGRAAGRGAYVCKDAACLDKAASGKVLDARLRTKLQASDYERLKDDFSALLFGAECSRDGE